MVDNSLPLSNDLPTEYVEDTNLPTEGLQDTISPLSKSMSNTITGYSAILKNHVDGSDIIENFSELEGDSDPQGTLQSSIAEKVQADVEDIEQTFIDNPGVSEADLEQNLQLTKQMTNEKLAEGNAVGKNVVEAASGVNADPAIQAKIAAQIQMLNDVALMSEELTTFDYVKDISGSFVIGFNIKDKHDLTGSVFGNEEIVRNMIVGFKAASAEDQLAAWPGIKAELLDALPKTQAVSLLYKFLNPLGEEDLSEFNDAWTALEIAEVAYAGYAIAKRLASLQRQLNGIRVMTKLRRTKEAADINTVAVMDETGQVAKAAGIDDVTAYSNSLPFNTSKIDESYTEGLSTEILHNINKTAEVQRTVSKEAVSSKGVVSRETIVNPAERRIAEEAFEADLIKRGMENIQVSKRTADETFFNYSITRNGEVLENAGRLDLQKSDVGVWQNTSKSLLSKFAFSPTVWAKGDAKDTVEAAIRLDTLGSGISEQFRLLQADAVRPLLGKRGIGALRPSKRASMARVDDVLLSGDEADKIYTVTELRAGVGGTPLDDVEIEVYYNLRNLYDNIYQMRDAVTRRKLVAEGKKEIRVLGNVEVGKFWDNAAEAKANLGNASKVVIDGTGEVRHVDKLDLKGMYDQGYVMTRLDTPIKTPDGLYDIVLTQNRLHGIRELPSSVLQYKAGYVPRVNKNAYYFLKEATYPTVNGSRNVDSKGNTLATYGKTHRYFDNEREAKEVLEEFNTANPGKKYVILEDRELEKQIIGGSNMGATSGLYTGKRSNKPIGFGKDNVPTERYSAFESISMSTRSLQNSISHNQWRIGQEQRWLNTAEAHNMNTGGSFNPSAITDKTEKGAFLRQMGEAIEEWNGFPTHAERVWDIQVGRTAEWALNRGMDREGVVVKGLHYLQHKDPTASMRAAAFHTLLGFLNPAQLWVQAQGASVALSLGTFSSNPLRGAKVLKDQFALSAAVSIQNSPEAMALAAKSAGLKLDDLVEMKELWKRTGYQDSILQTADHAASVKNHGIAATALRRSADKGLFFYKNGELFNRRISFLVALDEFKAANKGVKIGDEQLKMIMTRANNMMLNLTKANRAGFQKGIASVPTQFLQVQAKMAESMLGMNGSFTRGERAKIMVGQIALYGSAGVPLGDLAVRWYAENYGLSQDDVNRLDPETVKMVNEGFWGWFALSAFGADIEIANRGAIASGVEQLTYDIIFGEGTIGEMISGAFGVLPERFFTAYKRIKPLIQYDSLEGELVTANTVLQAASALASITSTWSNIEKGLFMAEHDMYVNKRYRRMTSPGEVEMSSGTIIGQMIGFVPSPINRIYDMERRSKALEDFRSKLADSIVESMYRFTQEIATAQTPEEEDAIIVKWESVQKTLYSSLHTPRDSQIVSQAVQAALKSGSRRSKVINKYLLNFNDGRLARLQTMHADFVGKGFLQVGE